jgi:hypothetical protein
MMKLQNRRYCQVAINACRHRVNSDAGPAANPSGETQATCLSSLVTHHKDVSALQNKHTAQIHTTKKKHTAESTSSLWQPLRT